MLFFIIKIIINVEDTRETCGFPERYQTNFLRPQESGITTIIHTKRIPFPSTVQMTMDQHELVTDLNSQSVVYCLHLSRQVRSDSRIPPFGNGLQLLQCCLRPTEEIIPVKAEQGVPSSGTLKTIKENANGRVDIEDLEWTA